MKHRFHKPEQIVKKLREADAAIASGSTVEQVCRQLGISDATLQLAKAIRPDEARPGQTAKGIAKGKCQA